MTYIYIYTLYRLWNEETMDSVWLRYKFETIIFAIKHIFQQIMEN